MTLQDNPAATSFTPVAVPRSPSGFRLQRFEESVSRILTSRIMIVDDDPLLIKVVRRLLQKEGYSEFLTVTDSREAMMQINSHSPDLVLLDIQMPHVTGLDIMRARQEVTIAQYIPFIILSASNDVAVKRQALELGASEFLSKPVDPSDLKVRVQNALLVKAHQDHLANYARELSRQVELRTAELERSREQIIHCLAKAAEFRDNDTGKHVVRVGRYSAIIADQLGFDAAFCRRIELAAQLHDVGKIGVPDNVLLNPGKLDAESFRIMQRHCDLGCSIIEPLAQQEIEAIRSRTPDGSLSRADQQSSLLIMAANIAKTHHENWDGNGYPNGLAGNHIPIEGRITAVADVYDALSSHRPYKPAYDRDKSVAIIASEKGRRLDPTVVAAFFERIDDIEQVRISLAD